MKKVLAVVAMMLMVVAFGCTGRPAATQVEEIQTQPAEAAQPTVTLTTTVTAPAATSASQPAAASAQPTATTGNAQ